MQSFLCNARWHLARSLPAELVVACQSSRAHLVEQRQPEFVNGRIPKRRLHKRRALPYDIEHGCQPFLSAQALRSLAVDYQEGLLDRLNDCVRGTPLERSSVPQTVIETAQDRTQSLAFNYASDALNNSFFLSRLSPELQSDSSIDRDVAIYAPLEKQFGSFIQFKTIFSAAAIGMSGSGYIWLVMDNNMRLGVIGTYGSGTVLVQNRNQRGDSDAVIGEILDKTYNPKSPENTDGQRSSDKDTQSRSSTSKSSSSSTARARTPSQSAKSYPPYYSADRIRETEANLASFADTMKQFTIPTKQTPPHEAQFHPLLCLSISERCWLPDYGVWGKEKYLANFWRCVDWRKVSLTYTKLDVARRETERATEADEGIDYSSLIGNTRYTPMYARQRRL